MIATKNSTQFSDILRDALKVTWCEFVKRTTIHGLRYITDEQGNKFTRLGNTTLTFRLECKFNLSFSTLWLIVTLVGFIASNVLVNTFWLRYKDNPTQLQIDSFHKPLNWLDLPAVTICQIKHIDEARAGKFVDELLVYVEILPINYRCANNIYSLWSHCMLLYSKKLIFQNTAAKRLKNRFTKISRPGIICIYK